MGSSQVILPISAVIATKDRPQPLTQTLETFAQSSALPAEILIVDASENKAASKIIESVEGFESSALRWKKATETGAARQRNEGVRLSDQPYILFLDDDIIPEPECLERLYQALITNDSIGGVSSMITNQQYELPGRLSRGVIHLLGGTGTRSDAGRLLSCIRNVLPAADDDLPEVLPVEWLNTTCTLYRREALPSPAFPPHFHGASVCEDLALSLVVAQGGWKLANARLARIFHDSQGGDHKKDQMKLVEEEFTNRAYILRRILGQTSLKNLLMLIVSQGFEATASNLASRSPKMLFRCSCGILCGVRNSTLERLPPHYSRNHA